MTGGRSVQRTGATTEKAPVARHVSTLQDKPDMETKVINTKTMVVVGL